MVAESWKLKEQRLLNEINNLKTENEELVKLKKDLELIITEKNKDVTVLKTNLDVNNKVLEHNQNQINNIVSERNKIEIDYNKIKEKINRLKNITLINRIFNYKKQFNNE